MPSAYAVSELIMVDEIVHSNSHDVTPRRSDASEVSARLPQAGAAS